MASNDPVKNKFHSIKRSAKSRGFAFNLTVKDVAELLSTQFCHYSGRELTSENFSVDRVKNELGYVQGNVVACCKEINQLKSNLIEDPYTRLTSEELKNVLKSFERFCVR